MKEDSYNYLKEVDWRPARRFEPNDINSIRSLALHCTDGILGFGTKAGSMHEFRFGDTNGGTDRQEAESAQVSHGLQLQSVWIIPTAAVS